MHIGVVGAGAIGGLLAGRLSLAGHQVTVIDQGAHLEAIRRQGLKLLMHDGQELVARFHLATSDLAEARAQELVVLGVKAYQISAVAPRMRPLLGPETCVVTVQNGIPWWYFQNYRGEHAGRRLQSLDPDGIIERHLPADRIIGCVVYPAGEVIEPGVVKHVEGDRFPVGELDGSRTGRVERISEAFIGAGFKSPVLEDVRAEIWLKLWGNLSFNPISALTHATLVDICEQAETRELAANMMREAQTVANKLGITFRHTIEKRIDGAAKVGKHKTSMLQDVEAGRALEVAATVAAVVELARLTDTPTPHIDAVYACTELLDRMISGERLAFAPKLVA
jgi:2-dehydropantoate 2-reductase